MTSKKVRALVEYFVVKRVEYMHSIEVDIPEDKIDVRGQIDLDWVREQMPDHMDVSDIDIMEERLGGGEWAVWSPVEAAGG